MKKFTAVLLAALLCLTALAGCAQTDVEPEVPSSEAETSTESSAEASEESAEESEVSEETSEESSEEVAVTAEPATYNVASLKLTSMTEHAGSVNFHMPFSSVMPLSASIFTVSG